MRRIIAVLRKNMVAGRNDNNVAFIHCAPYFFPFLGAVVMLLTTSSIPLDIPPPGSNGEYFAGGYASWTYWVWMVSSLFCPVLVWLSYLLPTRVRDVRFLSMWMRLAGDLGMFFMLTSLELATIKFGSAATIYRQILTFGFVAFSAMMLTRDVSLIVASERLMNRTLFTDSEEG